ncbi:MAG: kelch repeat-containing protein [Pseudomonadota bacterium]
MKINSISRRTALLAGIAAVSSLIPARHVARAETAERAGAWRSGPALPFAVQEIYPTLHAGRIHLAGGFVAESGRISGATDRHLALDLNSGVWSDQTALPMARHHPNLISFAGRLLAIGGFEAVSEQAVWVMQSGVWAFDGEVWSDALALPQPNGESVTGVIDDTLHVCGGRTPRGENNATWNDHIDVSDHFYLADPMGLWERAAPLPTARNSAAAGIIGSGWHVVGGRTVAGGNTAAHDVYDAREDRWRGAAPMPQGQGGLAAAAVNGKLYAFGGEFFDRGGGVYPQAWVYDPEADAWSALPDMPQPRHGLGAVASGSDIYLIGGALAVGGRDTSNQVEIFTPAST